MRIWFFWTPYLAARVLEDLISQENIEVTFVVSNPDKPFGRDQILRPTPVKELALKEWIPVFTPEKVRNNTEFLDTIRGYDCDYFVVVAYGKILPMELLAIPKKMCINVHGSILPKYRGASPIQSALLHGEKETGVTIMQMSEGMDEWDMIFIEKIAIAEDETSETLFRKFAEISGRTLIKTLWWLESGELHPIPQDASLATYCTKIEKEDGLIDWNQSSTEIYHKWQAYTPWPGIYTMYEGKRLLLEKVSLLCHREERSDPEKLKGVPNSDWIASWTRNDEQEIGKVIKLETGKIGIVCGEWILTLEQVKLEWKKSQNIRDFVNGNQKFIWITL